ncbi:interaptin-like [Sitodiplosis mosellana]|uniref:interaptin-like n=1 Tax=Sitodiplosis mosellana TaxID=263140 RepID=UPI002443AEC6|nr:interaptin-like [Sitodiplosis mosellana]
MDFYVKSMQTALRDIDPYLSTTELLETHETAKNESISQFLQKRKLGGDDLISSFVLRIENTAEERFLDFQLENNEKRKAFIDKANLHNEKLVIEIQTDFEKKILNEIERMESMSAESLKQFMEKSKESALVEFNAMKMGENNITGKFSQGLQQNMDVFQASTETMLNSHKDSVNFYSNLMHKMLNKVDVYATHSSIVDMHQNSKKKAIKQFQLRSHGIPAEVTSTFEHKTLNEIERKYTSFAQENERKRNNFISKARAYNTDLVEQIEKVRSSSAYTQIDTAESYLNRTELWNLWNGTKQAALDEFDSWKMGDSDLSSSYRAQLEVKMLELESRLESHNEYRKSLDLYAKSMEKALRDIDPYFSEMELFKKHETAKNESISQFLQERKLDDDDLTSSLVRRIENTTEERFLDFHRENDDKRKAFIDKANLHNEKLVIEIQTDFEKKILKEIERMESISAESLKRLLERAKESALNEFHAKMMGNSDIASSLSVELQQNMDDFQVSIRIMFTSYENSVKFYTNLMRRILNKVKVYTTNSSLMDMHQQSKKEAIKQLRSHGIAAEVTSTFQNKTVKEIERKYKSFAQENEVKRNNFIAMASVHNADLVKQIEKSHRSSTYSQVDNAHPYLSGNKLQNLWNSTQQAALKEYDSRKMGDNDISFGHRTQLKMKLFELKSHLKLRNDYKRSEYTLKNTVKTGGITMAAAAFGGAIAGPPGAIIGAFFGMVMTGLLSS